MDSLNFFEFTSNVTFITLDSFLIQCFSRFLSSLKFYVSLIWKCLRQNDISAKQFKYQLGDYRLLTSIVVRQIISGITNAIIIDFYYRFMLNIFKIHFTFCLIFDRFLLSNRCNTK